MYGKEFAINSFFIEKEESAHNKTKLQQNKPYKHAARSTAPRAHRQKRECLEGKKRQEDGPS